MRNSRCLNLMLTAVFLAGALTSGAGTLIDVAFTGQATTGKIGFAATGVSSSDFWNTYDVVTTTDLPNLKFTDGSPSGVGLTEAGVYAVADNGSSDPMYGVCPYVPGYIVLTLNNLMAGTYDFYLYGHGPSDDDNSVFQVIQNYSLEATTTGSNWISSIWQEGVQYVEFTNVNVSPGQPVTITVEPGAGGIAIISGLQLGYVSPTNSFPFVIREPADQSILVGSTATFSVGVDGATPLTYQWFYNNAPIAGATNSSYSVTNAQNTNAGNYVVIANDSQGSVSSAAAALNVIAPVTTLIDVAFTGQATTGKTGFAATGVSPNDFWNTYDVINTRDLPNLKFVDDSPSGAGLTETGVFSVNSNVSSDPMYGVYVWGAGGYIYLTVTNLFPSQYDFYLYGHGNFDDENGVFQLNVDSLGYGTEATTNGPGWLSSVWQEAVQYVEFTNVTVRAGQTVTITVEEGGENLELISGLQIAIPSHEPPTIIGVSNQLVSVNQELIITN